MRWKKIAIVSARPIGPKKSKKNRQGTFFFLFGCFFLLFYHLLFFFGGGARGLWIHGFNIKSANRKLGGWLETWTQLYSFPRFDCLPMWRWSAPGPSQSQLMWGQHQGRPTRLQTNKSRKRVSLVVGGILETKPNPKPPKSKIQNLKSKLQNPNHQNQNSKIQTPKIKTSKSKIKTPRSKPPKSKLQNQSSKIQNQSSKIQNQNSKIHNQSSRIQSRN